MTTSPRKLTVSSSPPGKLSLKHLVGGIIAAVVLFFLLRSIMTNWAQVRHFPWRFSAVPLVGSFLLVWLDFVILINLWRFLLGRIEKPLGFAAAYRVWFLTNLGKYVPGKVWTLLGMVYLLRQRGFKPAGVLAAALLNQAYSVLAGFVFVLTFSGIEYLGGHIIIISVLVGLLSLLVVYPPVFNRLLNFGLRLLGREPINVRLGFALSLGIFVIYLVTWLIYGLAFFLLLRAVGEVPITAFWSIAAGYAAAYLIGFLVLIAPGGLGVREGAVQVVLRGIFPEAVASGLALGSRLWMTICELLGLLPLLFINNEKNESDKKEPGAPHPGVR